MALPSAYLMSASKTADFLKAIRDAQAPDRFTQRFLEGLGFTSTNDRLFIGVLKSLGFLNDTGQPLPRYHEYMDQTQADAVLAEAIRDAYSDLFQVNANAQTMTKAEVKNKMKTLSQGEHSDKTLDRMALTFKSLADNADFDAPPPAAGDEDGEQHEDVDDVDEERPERERRHQDGEQRHAFLGRGGLHYDIHIHLPESRDPAVYDALFRSLREHL